MKFCYICGVEGATKEHVPPLSFFPRGFRKDLWTIPACKAHNIGNSKDIEYVRNLVAGHRNSKGTAKLLAEAAALRSFDRSAALFFETYQREHAEVTHREEAADFQVKLPRIERVVEAIAKGIHFREIGRISDGDWYVFIPDSLFRRNLEGVSNRWADFSESLCSLAFTPVATPQPAVFRYGRDVTDRSVDVVYRFEFYEGFCIYTWKV